MAKRRRRSGRAGAATLLGVLAVAFLPFAWERLPRPLLYSGIPGGPLDEDTRIRPDTVPARGEVIAPTERFPPSSSDAYAYLERFSKANPPVFAACEPMPYVVRRKAGPPNGFELVQEGLQQMANATGLSFAFEGFTDELAGFDGRSASDRLWIGWAFDDEIPELGENEGKDTYYAGVGGPFYEREAGGEWMITGGAVVLRSDFDVAHTFGPGLTMGNLLLHELGHALGLDHVDDKAQVMFPRMRRDAPSGLGQGDLAGLQRVRTACDRQDG